MRYNDDEHVLVNIVCWRFWIICISDFMAEMRWSFRTGQNGRERRKKKLEWNDRDGEVHANGSNEINY